MSTTVDLTVETLLEAAAREAELDDFGVDPFLPALAVYLDSVTREADLTETGLQIVQGGIVRVLVNRLRFVEDVKRHPEIDDETIVAPIVILGLVRTGTSKLQRLLSQDPGIQPMLLWRLLSPAPFPGASAGEPDPRIALALEFEQQLRQLAPDFMAAHPTLALEADEEAYLLDMTFECLMPQLKARVPSYAAWLAEQTAEGPYGFMVRMLKYLQWQDGGHQGRPWILKSPLHLGNFAVAARTFPDATFVHCHRDVTSVLPSSCRLVETARQLATTDVDPIALGAEMLDLWSRTMDNYLRDRTEVTRSSGVHVLDIEYEELTSDSTAVVERIYAQHGRQISAEARSAFRVWELANPPQRHGQNHYTLERYGLTEPQISSAFRSYLDTRR